MQIPIHSDEGWYFDDQHDVDVRRRRVALRNGDVLVSTCVYDSTGRDAPTILSVETTDEMCWVILQILPTQDVSGAGRLSCAGKRRAWTGALGPDDDARLVPVTHPHTGDVLHNTFEVQCDTSQLPNKRDRDAYDAAAVDALAEQCSSGAAARGAGPGGEASYHLVSRSGDHPESRTTSRGPDGARDRREERCPVEPLSTIPYDS